jgi:hypothetical protein
MLHDVPLSIIISGENSNIYSEKAGKRDDRTVGSPGATDGNTTEESDRFIVKITA